MSDIKEMLDSIINSTNSSYPNKYDGENHHCHMLKPDSVGFNHPHNHCHPVTFDAGKFREKLSLYVLKDLISAMMHDETTDLDGMIDNSIMNHIQQNYNGTCYGYLCNARDRLNSPFLGNVIQEIDDKTEEVESELSETKNDDLLNHEIDIKDVLKDAPDYDTFRKKLTEKVSNKVVDDVAGVLSKADDAPVFDNIDDEMKKSDNQEAESEGDIDLDEDVTNESVILKICGSIVTEAAINKQPISTEEGLNKAIVEYCIGQMDFLFKAQPKLSIYAKYKV